MYCEKCGKEDGKGFGDKVLCYDCLQLELNKMDGKKLKKGSFLPYFFTSLLLFGMFFVGLIDMYRNYQQYGLSYEVITIIGEVETISTRSLATSGFALFFIGWLGLLLFIAFRRIRYLEMNMKVD